MNAVKKVPNELTPSKIRTYGTYIKVGSGRKLPTEFATPVIHTVSSLSYLWLPGAAAVEGDSFPAAAAV